MTHYYLYIATPDGPRCIACTAAELPAHMRRLHVLAVCVAPGVRVQ